MRQRPAVGPAIDPGVQTRIEIADFHARQVGQERHPDLVVSHRDCRRLPIRAPRPIPSRCLFPSGANRKRDGVVPRGVMSEQSRSGSANPGHFIARAAFKLKRLAQERTLAGRQILQLIGQDPRESGITGVDLRSAPWTRRTAIRLVLTKRKIASAIMPRIATASVISSRVKPPAALAFSPHGRHKTRAVCSASLRRATRSAVKVTRVIPLMIVLSGSSNSWARSSGSA